MDNGQVEAELDRLGEARAELEVQKVLASAEARAEIENMETAAAQARASEAERQLNQLRVALWEKDELDLQSSGSGKRSDGLGGIMRTIRSSTRGLRS